MNPVAKWLLIAGAVLIIAGLFWQFGGRWLPFGRLPGDIVIERDHTRIYIPVVSCILLSILLSLLLQWFR